MRLQLAKLSARHNVTPPAPVILSLTEPVDQPLYLEGIAAHAGSIDTSRQKFRPYAIALPSMLGREMPPLLYRHDPKQIAGEIVELNHGKDGSLRIRALVSHALARRAPAFSVAVKVEAYQLKDVDTPNFHSVITACEISEVSLTVSPANSHALVTQRYPVPAAARYYDLMRDRVNCLIKYTEALQQICREQSEPAKYAHGHTLKVKAGTPKAPAFKPHIAVEPHRQTSFGALVRAIEARSAS